MRLFLSFCLSGLLLLTAIRVGHAQPNLMFNEFCYGATQNLPPNHPQHFVEIYNAEAFDVDISNWQLQHGMSLTFPAGTVIGANNYLVVTTPNQSTYTPSYNRVLLPTNDNLSSFDSLALRNNSGVLVDFIKWTWNATDWPTTAFNVFASVCLSDPLLDNSNGANWCHSAEFYGSPGADNTCRVLGCNNAIACNYQPESNYDNGSCIFCTCGYECGCMDSEALNYNPNAQWYGEPCDFVNYDILINEVKGGNSANNFVELYNNDDVTVDISGYRLQDDNCCNYGYDFYFPQGTSIAPGEYIVVHGATTQYDNQGYQSFTWTGTGNMTSGTLDSRLFEQHGEMIDSVSTTFINGNEWPYTTTGSRELTNPNANNALGANWCVFNAGTPGAQNSCYAAVITGCQDPNGYNYEPAATIAGVCDYPDGGNTCANAALAVCNHLYEGELIQSNNGNDPVNAGFTFCGFEANRSADWYRFDALDDAQAHIDLCFPETELPVVIQVFIGECGELYCYANSNNSVCDTAGVAGLDFYVHEGESYFIRLSAGPGYDYGDYRMNLTCDPMEVGCIDQTACNYDPQATGFAGCEYLSCRACTDATALNFDDAATIDDGSCYYTIPRVVINELNKNSTYQFIELYNMESYDVNMTGWKMNNGSVMTFPTDAIIPAYGYVVIGTLPTSTPQESVPNSFVDVFPLPSNYAISTNSYFSLYDANQNKIDSVSVSSGFPWNSSNQSRSAELINPALDNNYNSNWLATVNPNQYLANTSGFQNTRFDPMGLTCQDSTACNYDPFIESEPFNCDYTCFWPDATLDNDASNSPVVLNDGSTLRLGRSEMFSGNSMPQTQCAVGYNDAWFELNTRNYDTVQVSLNFIDNMPSIGCDIYRRVSESLMPVTCFTFSSSTVLNFHEYMNFGPNEEFVFSLYVLATSCPTCATSAIDIYANFFSRSCTDPLACNYNPEAIVDDGSCEYGSCYGCANEDACNYNPSASFDNGTCCFNRCVSVSMTPADVVEEMQWQIVDAGSAVVESGGFVEEQLLCLSDSCYTVVLSDTASNGWNGGTFSLSDEVGFLAQDSTVADSVDVSFSVCLNVIPPVYGCTNPTACNYNTEAEEDDGSCTTACGGCTVDWAMNFDPQATFNDGSCLFPPGEGTTCQSPIQLFCGGPSFEFSSEDVPNDNFNAGLTGLTCIGMTAYIGWGQYWFIYTDTVSKRVSVTIDQAVNTCLGFSPKVHVFRGTCGDFTCEPYDYSQPFTFDALAGETYYIRATIDPGLSSCTYWGEIHINCFQIDDGCTDDIACNYDANADVDDGTCDYSCLYGCMSASACNFDPIAIYDDGSCYFNCVYGCIDSIACNFNPEANTDDGTCIFLQVCVPGCTDAIACNFDPSATFENGTCDFACLFGCLEEGACNYAFEAIYNDFSCTYDCYALGCTDPAACNFNPYAITDNGSCLVDSCILGCMQPTACNYDSLATAEDFSCVYGCVFGCTNSQACNFNDQADFDDGSCTLPGCMVSTAVNYDASAICEGTCFFECVGDVDGSGAMDMTDFLMLMSAFGCVEDCGAMDLTGDGIVGVSDLQLFLSQFGVLCVE
ncbi:MAG: lamin tail domain-containing protein [Flavobacteriales bacterium]|jgi:hypothetical protein